ncbi:hypothetical protein ACLMAJ_28720 [Nocardia sp. KC 131]
MMKRSTLILATAGLILTGSVTIAVLDNMDGPPVTPVVRVTHQHTIGDCQ